MKKAKSYLLSILALCILTLNSCKKNAITDFNTINYLSANVDGESESSLSASATYAGGTLMVAAKLNGTEVISLSVKKAKVGTFDALTDNLILSYGTDATYENTYLGLTGTVMVTTLTSNTVSGTFEFVGTDSANSEVKIIKEGIFKCVLK